jgi:hypothetical protein
MPLHRSVLLRFPDVADTMAKSFTISGLAEPPRVTLNGRPADVRVAGQAFQISLA